MNRSSDFPPISGDSLPDLSDGFRLAGWTVDPRRNRASRSDHVETIEPKVMQVLLVLARHAGEPVTRDLLMEIVWPDVIVTDDTLTRCVSEARKIFDPPDPDRDATVRKANTGRRASSIIETIPKVGYSLVAPVEPRSSGRTSRAIAPDDVEVHPGTAPSSASARNRTPVMRGVLVAMVVVIAGGVILAGSRLMATDADTAFPSLSNPIPATSLAGVESMPAWSPDGSRIAFIHTPESGEESALMVGEPGDPQPLELFSAQRGSLRSPVWISDDRTIVFVHLAPDSCRILSVPALGGPANELASCRGSFTSIDISPDGSVIAMDDWPSSEAPVRIVLQDVATENRTTIPNDRLDHHDYAPRFSPDGRTVLFARSVGEGQMDLFLFDRDAGTVERLTHDKVGIAGHSWDTNGEHVFYSAGGPGGLGVRVLDIDTGLITDLGSEGTRPDVADGRLAFEVRRVDSDIHIQVDGKVTKACDSTREDRFPAIDRTGSFLVFASNRAGFPALYRCDLASNSVSAIESGRYEAVLAPRIGPSGRIAFTAVSDGTADVYVIDRVGEAPRKLTPSTSNDIYPAFSPDGKLIYFSSDRSGTMEIWRIPVGGGFTEQVTDSGGMAARLSPDGSSLFFQKEGEPGLWRIALNHALPDDASGSASSFQKTALVDDSIDLSSLFSWIPTEGGILISRRSATGVVELELLNPDTGTRRTVRSIAEGRLSYGFATTPDLSVVALAVIERIESDIMTATLKGSDIRLVSGRSDQ